MSLIHVARHGQSLGTFNEDDLREGMNQQSFHGDDLVWKQGMSEWRPLHEMAREWKFDELTAKADAKGKGMPPLPVLLPWEELGERSFFSAFLHTLRAVLFAPKKTFSQLDSTGGFAAPLLYYVMVASTVFIATLLMLLPQVLKDPASIAPQLAHFSQNAIIAGFVGIMVVAPFLFVSGIFVSSFITHLSLKILGVAQKPFKATFRVVCYSFGSISFCSLIPFVGGVIGIVWGLVLYFIGLKEVHTLSKWRTFFVILTSIAIYLLLVVAVMMLLSYMGLGAVAPAVPVAKP